MVYTKASAEVISLNNVDVINTISGESLLFGVSAEDLAAYIGVQPDHAQDLIDAAQRYHDRMAFINALTGGLFPDYTVNDAQNTANAIHTLCPTESAKNWSAEAESGFFDEEWDDNETDW